MTTATATAVFDQLAPEAELPQIDHNQRFEREEATVLPIRELAASTATPRAVGGISRDDMLALAGSATSAFCFTLLLFGRLTPLSGKVGFVAVFFVVFVAIYALIVSLDNDRPAVIDKVMSALLTSCALVAGVALVSVIVFIGLRGYRALLKTNLYTEDMSLAGPLDPLDVGGIAHAIVGSLIIMTISLILTVPLAIICAVYLNETGGRLVELVRAVVTAMTALPSIVAGLFVYATWILILGFEQSGLAAAIAISIMMLPIIVRSADVVLRLVPGNLREASEALGAPQWRTVRHVVLPTARPGLATSIILGVARGVGETAPVLLVSGVTQKMNTNPVQNRMMSLPLATFEFVRSPQETLIARGFATASVLMILVLILFSVARVLGGRPAGRLSRSQQKRATARSKRDVERFDARRVALGADDLEQVTT
jgi:phosphate transport system permease protein